MAKEIKDTPEEKAKREQIETIAKNIKELTRSVQALLNGELSRKAIVVLLANSSGYTQTVVNSVLVALENLERDWLNSKKN